MSSPMSERVAERMKGTTITLADRLAARLRGTGPDVNPLEEYFRTNRGRLIHKWHHYFDIYDRHFAPYRGQEITVVEFGVSHGGSLQMWKEYFGPKAHIVGVDIDPRCAAFVEDRIDVVTRSIRGMHAYDSIIVFDKGVVPEPVHTRTGVRSW